MRSFIVFALIGALLFVAVQARPSPEGEEAAPAEGDKPAEDKPAEDKPAEDKPADGDKKEGVAGFPLESLLGEKFTENVKSLTEAFKKAAGDASAYVAEEVGNLVKLTGNVMVMAKDGSKKIYDTVFIDGSGKILDESKKVIDGAIGLVGGAPDRLKSLSEDACKRIQEGFESGKAFLSALPNDVWVFGKARFDDVATIAADGAKKIKELGDGIWSNWVPLSDENKGDLAALAKGGIDLALSPWKAIAPSVTQGFGAVGQIGGAVGELGRAAFAPAFIIPAEAGKAGLKMAGAGSNMAGRFFSGLGNFGAGIRGGR